ncbi:polyprenyl synthetase family protein [Streptomyces sp. DT2A-34]|uniref:polyprenyl synthetase family protein n=1 Tax=Streptomyces sp. DT2A-34 TaxID=3051182 RepID=UPI00265BD7B4|nr:polyprenyl synthetase family protein [Streptomyces sp. DT2A-34]MDO0917538.1 polyprenyl synthetase family protein [Streptomyces sp. DT2A-34]
MSSFAQAKTSEAHRLGLPGELPAALARFLAAGGKRIRPVLCVLGWHAAGGTGSCDMAVRVGAALEVFHAFCLVHDDVMDHSDTRRGQPTVHRVMAERHRTGRSPQQGQDIGAGAAVLAGDLAFVWTDELLHTADPGPSGFWPRVRALFDTMRSEVIYGQYLDLTATGRPSADMDRALAIVHYKTAKYTLERPLQIGAALAGADTHVLDQLSAFALPLGEAFQLRDDLLGVFGTPTETGKPRLDDLREGKHTALIAHTLTHATRARADQLRLLLGCPTLTEDQAEVARRIITHAGSREAIERMITDRYEQALAALDRAHLPAHVDTRLRELAQQAAWRTS